MAAEYDRQYRPITTEENQGDDALTVRALQEGATSANNYKAHFGPVLIPGAIYVGTTGFLSDEDESDERVIHMFAPREVPHGYNFIHWQVGGAMIAGSSGNCAWRLYTSTEQYDGPVVMDRSFLGDQWDVDSATLVGTADQEPAGSKSLIVVRNVDSLCYLTLTAQNTIKAGGEAGRLTGISANAYLEEASAV